MLPTAGSQADGKSGSFQNMLSKYGLASSVAAGQYNIAAAPLYFVRSGHVALPGVSGGTFRYAGQVGYGWSSRGADNIWGSAGLGDYYLAFNATGVYPSYGPGNRYAGFSLRCLSTVLDMM